MPSIIMFGGYDVVADDCAGLCRVWFFSASTKTPCVLCKGIKRAKSILC